MTRFRDPSNDPMPRDQPLSNGEESDTESKSLTRSQGYGSRTMDADRGPMVGDNN